MHDQKPPSAWLWQEIERRFGPEEAQALHRDYNEHMRLYARRQAIKTARLRLPGLRLRLSQAQRAGRATKRLEAAIARAEQRLCEAGEERE